MSETEILKFLHDTAYGTAVRDIYWLFPLLEIVHFIGLCVLFGAMLVVDLRLLGFARRLPLRTALGFIPMAVVAFVFSFISGMGFFCNSPLDYWPNPSFKLKVVLLIVAGLNALWFEFFEKRKLQAQPADADVAVSVKICAGLSLSLWLTIIVLGRLLPYTGTSQ